MFKAAVVSLVALEQSLNGDASTLVFGNRCPVDKLFAVISVQRGVDQCLRHGGTGDMLNTKGWVGFAINKATSQDGRATGRKVMLWST